MRSIYSFLRAKAGASGAEYALILAILGAGIAAGIIILGVDMPGTQPSAGTVTHGSAH